MGRLCPRGRRVPCPTIALACSGFADAAVLVAIFAFAMMLISIWLSHFRDPHGVPRRASCLNNQRQVARAILTKTIRQGAFPRFQKDFAGQAIPWTVAILPELGRPDLYYLLQEEGEVPPVQMEVLLCPADSEKWASGPAPLSYVINGGCAQDAGIVPANGISLNGLKTEETTSLEYVGENDGTAMTLLLAENLQATRWDLASRVGTNLCVAKHDVAARRPPD